MNIEFIKTNPTENMTILIKTACYRGDYPEIAMKLMDYSNVFAEQTGFIEKPVGDVAVARLHMAGGEFCGNAALSLGAYLAWEKGLPVGGGVRFPLEVSGAEEVIDCSVKAEGSRFYVGINLPLPREIKDVRFLFDDGEYLLPVIYFDGISHVIVMDEALFDRKEEVVESCIDQMPAFTQVSAMGIMFYDEKEECLRPFVYVKSIDSRFWERGCGSGTAAFGCYLARKDRKSVTESVKQPGGEITVKADYDKEEERVTHLEIYGYVTICATGTAYI